MTTTMNGIRRKKSAGSRHGARSRARGQEGFGLIEAIVAIVIGAIGLLAVAGLQLASATQARIAESRTTQAFCAQQVFEEVHREGYAAAVSRTYTATVDGRSYTVTVNVSNSALKVKRVIAQVPAMGSVNARTFEMRIYEPRPVPAGP